MSFEFNGNKVCHAGGVYWSWIEPFDFNYRLISESNGINHFDKLILYKDFKLNEIRIGDYIEKSELDTEQKYNDVVDAFGLFGFHTGTCYESMLEYGGLVIDMLDSFCSSTAECKDIPRKLTYNQIMAIGKLKRMIDERSAPKTTPEVSADIQKVTTNKYEREISGRQGNSAIVDVYDVLKAFNVTCPATQHAVKKLLCSGIRGYKDLPTDLVEAKESIVRAIELNDL